MTREEFNKEMERLNVEKRRIIEEFINSLNIGFYKGKKVKCYKKCWNGKEEYIGDGFVAGVDRQCSEPYYKINKIKKDGTMANASAGYWHITRVELIEE